MVDFGILASATGAVGLLAAAILYYFVLKQPRGSDAMAAISDQIHLGAMTYLRAQYTRIGIFAAVIAGLLAWQYDSGMAAAFLFGGFFLGRLFGRSGFGSGFSRHRLARGRFFVASRRGTVRARSSRGTGGTIAAAGRASHPRHARSSGTAAAPVSSPAREARGRARRRSACSAICAGSMAAESPGATDAARRSRRTGGRPACR